MNKKLVLFNLALLLISILIFGEYLINFASTSSSYILFLLFFCLLALHIFVIGIICNQEKIYKQNIKLYLLLYIILLISLTIFINRPSFALFDYQYLQDYLNNINIIPFKTIIHFLNSNINFGIKIYNILGNIIALIPLSLLLIFINDKYLSYKKQFIVLFLTVLGIELCQFLLAAGRFDIDDFILNIGGALLFLVIIKKTKTINTLKHLFNNDLNIPPFTKYIILIIVSVAIIIMDVLFCLDLNIHTNDSEKVYFEVSKDTSCDYFRKIELANYNLYLKCIEVYFTNQDNYQFSLESALTNGELDLNNLDKYFKIVEFLENVTIYRNNNLVMFTCNNNQDIYVGDETMEYKGECE